MKEALWVGVGGFLGAIARYAIGGWITARVGSGLPYGTFVINVTGSFILGFIMGSLEARTLSPIVRLTTAVGFVGAYTTFSTFTYETLRLVEDGSFLLATANVVGSVLTGIVSGALGLATGRGI